MANKSLTDLTERTATADSDLIHVNSGGTDYKQTKLDFAFDIVQYYQFDNTTSITAQCSTLGGTVKSPACYFGKINSYGHQSATGVPWNNSYHVKLAIYSGNYMELELTDVDDGAKFYKINHSGTWDANWTQQPTRAEITSINNSLANKQDNISVTMVYYGSVNANSSYSITGSANQVYFIVFGTWNFRKICFADPQNGGTPRVTDIGASSNLLTITANGDWGLTFNNGTIYSMPLIIRRLN